MYNRQLNTFLKVAECGSFNRAAEELYVSASAVIQQINSLERELNVTLFTRSRRGIRLTDAGEFLAEEARGYIHLGEQIMDRLRELETQRPCIYVGTSMEEKCRLLYDLWMLFSPRNTNYDIRLVRAQNSGEMPLQAQIVEGYLDGAAWQAGWEFLEICEIPLCCAVAKDHPLAKRKKLELPELRENGVLFVDRSLGRESSRLHRWLQENGIPYEARPQWGSSLIWDCAVRKTVLLIPSCMQDVVVDLITIPCVIDVPIPYGFFYRRHPTKPVREFLDFIRSVYDGTDPQGIVPVL